MSHDDDREQDRDDPRTLLGAYVLDAVDDDERAEVEALVLRDHEARAELHALQLGASWLARADGRPAPHVWEAIRAEVGADDRAPVVSLDAKRRTRIGRTWRGVTAAAAAAALVFVGLSIAPSDSRDSVAIAALEAAGNPKSERVHLAGTDDARVEVVMLPSGRGYVIDGRLPNLDDDRTYQLWAITNDGPVSAGLLGREVSPTEVRMPRGTSSLAVTAEQRGGSDSPTGDVLASGELT